MDQTQPRMKHAEDELVPPFMSRLLLALVFAVLALVAIATLTDRPLNSTPADTPIIAERMIVIAGKPDGSATVRDTDGALIASFTSDKGGFVAGIERVLIRERAKIGANPAAPVHLQLREGNRLSLTDPATGWSAELMGFGADNTRTFARLLAPPQ
ncbi:MAG: photosynthetic complex assembly protein PuhC [Pseudomonadota bacterium]